MVDIEYDDIHTKIHGSFLSGEACTKRIVEENEQGCLVLTKILPLEAVALHFLRFREGDAEAAEICNVLKNFHWAKGANWANGTNRAYGTHGTHEPHGISDVMGM